MSGKHLLIALLFVFPSWAQEADYQHGIIVLNDGRVIAMRGEIEFIGEEARFLDGRGELVTLPANIIDLDETNKRNKAIRDKSDTGDVVNDGSLYSQVERYKQTQNKREFSQTDIETSSKETQNQAQQPPRFDWSDWQQFEQLDTLVERFQTIIASKPWLPPTMIVFAILLALFGLVSLVVHLYLIFIAYRDSALWGLFLTSTFFGPSIIIGAGFIFGASNPLYQWLPSILNLLNIISFPLFIVICLPGRRLRFLFLWGMIYLVALLMLATLVIAAIT